MLRGKSAGVVVVSGSGQPGSGATIRVRGGSSLKASNDPLIVIDGLPVGNESISGLGDPLSSINSNDIESFTILKDASATAIYGSRASNGVIVITTKKGSRTATTVPNISFDLTSSVSQVSKYVDVMNAAELKQTVLQYAGEDSDAYKIIKDSPYDTNWQKEIYQLAPSFDANLSLTGRVKLGKAGYLPYRVSGGYLKQEGTLKTSAMDRGTLSLNLTPTLLDEHLTINLNGKGTFAHSVFANQDAITQAAHMIPSLPVYTDGVDLSIFNGSVKDQNGYTAWFLPSGSYNTEGIINPVAALNEKQDEADVTRFIGNAQLNYKVHGLEDLSFNVNLGMDYSKSDGWNGAAANTNYSLHQKSQAGAGYHTDYTYERMDQTLEAYAAYNKDFNKNHHFDVMAGYSWQHFHNNSTNYTYLLDDAKKVLTDNKPATEYFLVSFFGRLNYSYANRYMITATVRRDGSSRFLNNKWGLFPSVALGWNIKNENFLKSNAALSALKLRLSWGQTGQQDLNAGNYPAMATYATNELGSYYSFGGAPIVPITPLGYNADLKWETTTTYNAGLDYGFLDGRIFGSLDVYLRQTKDLINSIPVAALSNLTNYLTSNIGNLENKGFEFEVNAIPVQTKDFSWIIGANVAYNQNKITKLTAAADDMTGIETGGINGGVGNNIQMHQVGFPASAFYVYQQVYDKNGKPIEGEYVDRNGNGKVDADDRYFFHKPSADVTVGLNTSVTYKNWTLAASGHGSFGNWMYSNIDSDNEKYKDLWTNSFISNRMASSLTTNFASAQFFSDYYVRDASFFKIDNVTLGYTFPSLFKSAKLDRSFGLNIFATVQNLATITQYKGIDPEIFNGIDYNLYPRPRTYILGLKLNF